MVDFLLYLVEVQKQKLEYSLGLNFIISTIKVLNRLESMSYCTIYLKYDKHNLTISVVFTIP